MPIPTREQNPSGLYQRYIVKKVDGSPIDPEAEYFVLRLDCGGSDIHHIAACRAAIHAYADAIKRYLPQLAQDLMTRYLYLPSEVKDAKLKCDEVVFKLDTRHQQTGCQPYKPRIEVS